MKKLLAILLSMLLLCSMIPFATVSAAGEYYIELVADAEEVNAGEDVMVEVNLYGHESVGLIGAQIELGFDHDVFELVTYYDEDEEMWMPPIEVGPKFSASSNKYIMFSPIDEETGYMKTCLVQYVRGTATASQAVKTNLFYTVTLHVKDDAPSGTYEIDFINYNKKNIICYGNAVNDYTWEPVTITVNGTEPDVPSCEHEYTYACDKVCAKCGELTNEAAEHNVTHVEAVDATCDAPGNVEYWYCDICGSAWLDAECTIVTNMMSVVTPIAHNVIHVEAKDATCFEPGNIEYWYCEDCGAAWLDELCHLNTNLNAVILPIAHNVIHVEAVEPTCFEPGNIEYWYCEDCGSAWLDELCHLNTNLKAVVLPIAHNVIHVEAKAPTCTEEGNIEYWFCEDCGSAWLDELCHLNTNLMAVKLGATCSTNAIYTAAKEATCFEPGNVEYWYCENCDVFYLDAECTIITNAKSVVLPISHNVTHVEAKAPTCTEEGNIEYWFCEDCGSAWLDELCHLNTNLMAVKLGASCKYNAVYTAAKEATCFEPGNVEYWYCENCDVYYLDAECTIITNAKSVVLPIAHNVIHVEAKAPTCFEPGNIEYWYCEDCGSAWLDEYCHLNTNLMAVILPISHNVIHVEAVEPTCFEPGNIEYWYCEDCGSAWLDELCHLNTNLKAVILPIAHNVIHVEAKDATCDELGNIEYWFCEDCGSAWLDELCHLNTNLKAVVLPMADHTYDNDLDVDCNICGDIREIEHTIITFSGKSISEDVNGLAFKFDVSGEYTELNLWADTLYLVKYDNCTVTPNTSGTYKLVEMGANLYNGKSTAKAVANKVVDVDSDPYFVVRVLNIPEANKDTVIYATPYYAYDVDGDLNTTNDRVIVYGEEVSASYNEVAG